MTPTRRSSILPASRGFTLLEVMISVTILSAAMVGMLSGIITLSRMNAFNRENLAALRGFQRMVETLKGTDFDKIFPLYNAYPGDDPLPGPGTAPGPDFDVAGLVPQDNDPDGKCGKILFPTDPGGSQLREDVTDPDLLMPRDLNGNGIIDSGDVSATCTLLPVTLRIDWKGVKGPQTYTFRTYLMKKKSP